MNVVKKPLFIKTVIFGLTISSLVKGEVYASTYLESDKNYYTDPAISRGFLDSPISKELLGDQNWNMFQVAVSKNLVSYNPGMTFNQYYLANNISPEDNFIVYPGLTNQIVRLKSGAYLNANPNPKGAKDDSGNVVDYITYVGPTDDRGAYWGDKELEDPVLFSRLTVGELPSASEGTLGLFNSGTYLFPTQIGYGENATVNDYMLTPGNDFIIPTRFNTIRNDVYLTMRSRAYFGAGLQGAQASLTATSNGKTVVGSSENSKFYIDTNSNVYLTKQGFDQLGNFAKFMAPSVYTSASNNLKKVGIDKFSAMMNQGLSSIQSNSGANTIVSGNGGQIQLSGFDRETDLDGAFSSSISDRENDALKNTDVNFYMYTKGNTETNVTTPLAPNGYHLYSPNVSEFKIQTTRPYFSWTGDISNAIKISEANADFDDLLGSNSLQVTDNGVDSDGTPISVDLSRVRIRISEDGGSTYSNDSYTLNDLKALLTSGNITIPKIVIAYTYSATDSKTDNIGKLPSEIDDNTGAYAVPFTRTLTNDIPDKKSNITVKYIDISGNTISDNIVKTGNLGEPYTTEQKSIPGYTFKEVQGSASGQFTDQEQTVTYVYTKDPVAGGNVTVKYVDGAGNTISDNVVKSGNIGDDYITDQKAIPGYTFKEIQGSASGQFTDQEQTVTYVYTKDPVAGGNVTVKYVDGAGNTISDNVVKSGNIGDDYITDQKAIPGYTFKEIQGSASGQFTDQEQTVTYVYTKDPVAGGNVTVKYVDGAGNTISDNVVKSGNIGDDYITDQKAIPGYTFKAVQGNPTGQFTSDAQTVTYIYTKDPVAGGNVTVKYVDGAGNTISDNVVKSGNIGDDYSTDQKAIPGYTFKEVQGSASGQFTDQEQTVTYVYTKDPVAGGNVTVKYVDGAGNTISDNVVKSGNIGDDYSTDQKAIPGYTFKEVQGSASGQFTDQEQTVTYVYTKDPVAGGSVTAKYVDTSGNAISDNVVKTGNIGDTYSTEQKTIPGYTFKEVQGSASGQFTDQEQTVTYVYTKDPATTASTSTTTVEPTTTVSTSTTTVEPTTTVAATTTTVEPTTTAAATTTTVEPTTTVAATTTTVEPTTTVAATTTTVEPTTTASTSTTTVEPTTTVSTSTTTVEPTTTVAATTTTVEPTTTAAATTTTVEPTTTVAATTTTVEPTTTASTSTTTVEPTTTVSTSTTTVEPTTTVAATTTTVEPTTTAAATTTTVEPTTTVAATTTTVEPTTTVAATTTTVEPTTTASTSTTTVEPTTTVSTSTTTVEPTTTVAATTTTVEPTTTAAATTTTVEPTTTVAATTTTVEPTTTAAATTTTASTTTVAPTTSVTTTAATTVDVPGTTTGVTPPPAGGKKGRTLPKTGEESGLTTSLVGFALMSVASVAAVLYRKSKKA